MHNTKSPPPRYGTRKNPTTGRTATYELPAPIDLEASRKELRDTLHGGGWFDDPLRKPDEGTVMPAAEARRHGAPEWVAADEAPTTEDFLRGQGMAESPPGSGIWVFP